MNAIEIVEVIGWGVLGALLVWWESKQWSRARYSWDIFRHDPIPARRAIARIHLRATRLRLIAGMLLFATAPLTLLPEGWDALAVASVFGGLGLLVINAKMDNEDSLRLLDLPEEAWVENHRQSA